MSTGQTFVAVDNGASEMQNRASVFEKERKRLGRIAYGLLGSVSEAEDAVQDAYLRFETSQPGELRNPEGWLTTVVTRVAIDRLRSAARQREVYPGTWLPEPVVTVANEEDQCIEREKLTMALLFVLERLDPVERAVFLLREIFDVAYREIAAVVDKSEAACRQIYVRAKTRVRTDVSSEACSTTDKREIVDRYSAAIFEGDEEKLRLAVTDDVIFYADSGGKVAANVNPLYGADRLVRFIQGLRRKLATSHLSGVPALINGEPGLLVLRDGAIDSAIGFQFEGHRIAEVYSTRNPDKLASHAGASASTIYVLISRESVRSLNGFATSRAICVVHSAHLARLQTQ